MKGGIYMDYILIGQRIRTFRKKKGYSQMQLAELLNISTTHMSHIETGTTKLSLPVLVDISRVLEVSTDELLFGPAEQRNAETRDEIDSILHSCTPQQRNALIEILKTAKAAMVQN